MVAAVRVEHMTRLQDATFRKLRVSSIGSRPKRWRMRLWTEEQACTAPYVHSAVPKVVAATTANSLRLGL